MKELIEKLEESKKGLEADIESCRASKDHDKPFRLVVLESRYLIDKATLDFLDALKGYETKQPYNTQ